MATQGADLVILDLGLPDLDGKEVLQELRSWSNVPVIVLSVRADEYEKVALLDAGANDYMTKPFSVQELLARIRVILRNQPIQQEAHIYDDGYLKVDVTQRLVWIEQQPITLTRKEFQLLTLLMRYQGQLLTQPQLLKSYGDPPIRKIRTIYVFWWVNCAVSWEITRFSHVILLLNQVLGYVFS